jgi:hypothetical protein
VGDAWVLVVDMCLAMAAVLCAANLPLDIDILEMVLADIPELYDARQQKSQKP